MDERRGAALRGAHLALTGASGAVGGAVRHALAEQGCRLEIVGRRDDATLRWDLREPMPAETARALRTVDLVVHCAADVRLGNDQAAADRINSQAVAELVRTLAGAATAPRLVHISTAFVDSGGGEFHNPYEASKHAAEQLVLGSGLHGAIVRPSLVIGRTADGTIPRFSGIYTLVRLIAQCMVPAVPTQPGALVDVVPVDAVAGVILDAIVTSLGSGHRGVPVTTVASGAAAPTVEYLFDTVTDLCSEVLGAPFPRPSFVTPDTYHRLFRPLLMPELSGGQKLLIEALEVFFPYLTAGHAFPTTVVRLEPGAVAATWRRSVRYWLAQSGHRPAVRSAAWAPRRAG